MSNRRFSLAEKVMLIGLSSTLHYERSSLATYLLIIVARVLPTTKCKRPKSPPDSRLPPVIVFSSRSLLERGGHRTAASPS